MDRKGYHIMDLSIALKDDRNPGEMWWVTLQPFLKSNGYVTRARYQPDWQPSWTELEDLSLWTMFEDSVFAYDTQLMDAVRESDGQNVMMKEIREQEGDHSRLHMQFFSDELRSRDPRNHCLPLFDVLVPPGCSSPILVTPRLLPWDLWPFSRISEIVSFIDQLFEGLAFMHEHNFAHFDVGVNNIMMDGIHLFTEPHHPLRPYRVLHGFGHARHRERHQSPHPVKYYFIDFEYSIHFDSFADRVPMKRRGAQDKTVPEEQNGEPCDPFAVDVYCAGNLVRTYLLQKYSNLEFVRDLVDDMTQADPSARPSASDATLRFASICASLSKKQLRARPKSNVSRANLDNTSGRKSLLGSLLSTVGLSKFKFKFKGTAPTPPNPPTTDVSAP